MYPPLKQALWNEVDAGLAEQLTIKPQRKTMNRRVYPLERSLIKPFLVVEYDDFAGGRFSFLCALGHGAAPSAETVYAGALMCPAAGSVCLVDAALLEPSCPTLEIELAAQTPPPARIREALLLESAKPWLASLGVTESEGHGMLSFDILESLAVPIPEGDWKPIVHAFGARLRPVVHGPLARAAAHLLEVSRRCNEDRAG